MYYELHRTDTLNLVADFDTLEDALAAVREAVRNTGPVASNLLLLRVPEHGRPREHVAGGRDLIELSRHPSGGVPTSA